jgi:hypothetical protein
VCIESPCFCFSAENGAPAKPGTIEARVISLSNVRTEFTVESLQGTAPGSGGSLILPREEGDELDSRWLLFFDQGQFWKRARLTADGKVVCSNVSMSVKDARDFYDSRLCGEHLARLGFVACPEQPSCSAAPGALALVAAVAFITRRRGSSSRS